MSIEQALQPTEWRLGTDANASKEIQRFALWHGCNVRCGDYELALRCNKPERLAAELSDWPTEHMGWECVAPREVGHNFWFWFGGRPGQMRDYHYVGHDLVPLTRTISLERALRQLRLTLAVHGTWARDQLWLDGVALEGRGGAVLVFGDARSPIVDVLGYPVLEDPLRLSSDGATSKGVPVKAVLFADGRDYGPVDVIPLPTDGAAEKLISKARSRLQHQELLHQVRWALESAHCYEVVGDGSKLVLSSP